MGKNKTVKKKAKKKIDKKEVSKKNNNKKKKGFTLIELLAVIIILGILMIIAIPSVTKYISDSRKSAYVDTAKEIVSGTRNRVNDGKLGMYDTNTTYYIPSRYIQTENASKSPYGEFTEAYVGVIYDGKGYKYYWISIDDAGQGVKDITLADKLDTDDIVSDLRDSDIVGVVETTGIGNREKILILNPDTETWNEVVGGATNHITEEGIIIESRIVCKKATTLHSTTCTSSSSGCGASGAIGNGKPITYGTLVNGAFKGGDAFDCDVNNDEVYDSETERFYYITSDGDNSVLIYYNNIDSQTYPYNSWTNDNYHGPKYAYSKLPSSEEWSNPGLIAPGTRQIVAENNETTIGSVHIDSFEYTDKVARFLTYQEVEAACNKTDVVSSGAFNSCNFLMEGNGYYEMGTPAHGGGYGYWLETPRTFNTSYVWVVHGSYRMLYYKDAVDGGSYGVRPVITIKTSEIES